MNHFVGPIRGLIAKPSLLFHVMILNFFLTISLFHTMFKFHLRHPPLKLHKIVTTEAIRQFKNLPSNTKIFFRIVVGSEGKISYILEPIKG